MSSGIVAEDALLRVVREQVPNPQGVLAIFTGCVWWSTAQEFFSYMDAGDEERSLGRLLELRVYDASSEYHAQRSAMGLPLAGRLVRDADFAPDEMLDDVQLLDKDARRSSGTSYVTTGGGKYTLPVPDAERILIRNYIAYGEDDGMASIVDFRIVGLEGGFNG